MHLVDWIILAIIGAIAVYLHTGYAARRDIRRLLEETLAELRRVVDALDEPFVDLDDDAPDMIAALGSTYAPNPLRPKAEAAIAEELGLTSREMTARELVDALLGDPDPLRR
jgi:hypothetical protein